MLAKAKAARKSKEVGVSKPSVRPNVQRKAAADSDVEATSSTSDEDPTDPKCKVPDTDDDEYDDDDDDEVNEDKAAKRKV